MASSGVPPVGAGRPRQWRLQRGAWNCFQNNCFTNLERGGKIEKAPCKDDIVVGAEEEGDDDRANSRALQERAELAQRANGSSPGRSRVRISQRTDNIFQPCVLSNSELHEEKGHPTCSKHHQVLQNHVISIENNGKTVCGRRY